MTNSFATHSKWIKVNQSSNFSHDILYSIQEIINETYSDNNLQQQEKGVLMLESISSANDRLDFLTDFFLDLGNLEKTSGNYVCFFIEDIHCLKKQEAQALIMAIHRANQLRLPIMVFPQLQIEMQPLRFQIE